MNNLKQVARQLDTFASIVGDKTQQSSGVSDGGINCYSASISLTKSPSNLKL